MFRQKRVSCVPWPWLSLVSGPINYEAQLEMLDKCRPIKVLLVCWMLLNLKISQVLRQKSYPWLLQYHIG